MLNPAQAGHLQKTMKSLGLKKKKKEFTSREGFGQQTCGSQQQTWGISLPSSTNMRNHVAWNSKTRDLHDIFREKNEVLLPPHCAVAVHDCTL